MQLVSIKKNKKKGSIFISSIITLLLLAIVSGGVFSMNSNMISLCNKQKENLCIKSALLSETNYYSSLKTNTIENKEYTLKDSNFDINMSVEVVEDTNNYIEIMIKASTINTTKEQKIKLIKKGE